MGYNKFLPLFTKNDHNNRRFLDLKERKSVLKVINDRLDEEHPRYYLLYSVLYWTGASLSEVLPLRVRQIDVINESVLFTNPMDSHNPRTFKMPERFMRLVIDKYSLKSVNPGSQSHPERCIICNKEKSRLTPRWDARRDRGEISKITKNEVMKNADGIDYKEWYAGVQGLRLSFVYHQIVEKGKFPEEVCKIMGMNPDHAGEYYKFYAWHNGAGDSGELKMRSGIEAIRNLDALSS